VRNEYSTIIARSAANATSSNESWAMSGAADMVYALLSFPQSGTSLKNTIAPRPYFVR
jgi:hypothetical protein